MGEERAGTGIILSIKTHLRRHKCQIQQELCLSTAGANLIPSPLPGCAEARRSPLRMPATMLKALLFPEKLQTHIYIIIIP